MPADTTARPVLTGADASRILLRGILRIGRRNGWTTRWPINRRRGLWSWVSVHWPHHTLPPADARRVTWDGKILTIQAVSTDPAGWRTILWAQPASIRQVVLLLVAAGALPESVTR